MKQHIWLAVEKYSYLQFPVCGFRALQEIQRGGYGNGINADDEFKFIAGNEPGENLVFKKQSRPAG